MSELLDSLLAMAKHEDVSLNLYKDGLVAVFRFGESGIRGKAYTGNTIGEAVEKAERG